MEFISDKLTSYVLAHTSKETELLNRINRETNLEVLRPRMLSGHLQGRALATFSKMIEPEYILEIGTYTGYSALCLAEGLANKGKLITIEKNEELADRIRGYFAESKYADQLNLKIGEALSVIAGLPEGMDLVFIDADKFNYLNYYESIIDKMKVGGYILADNVLWSGKVVEPVDPDDIDTISLKKFNRFVYEDERVENVLLPIRDGLMIIRKK